MPPQHLSRRRRHSGSGAAPQVRRQARVCHQLLHLRGSGTAGDHGENGLSQGGGDGGPVGPFGRHRRCRTLEGAGAGLHAYLLQASGSRAGRHPQSPGAGPRSGKGSGPSVDCRLPGIAGEGDPEFPPLPHTEFPAHRGYDAEFRPGRAPRQFGASRRHHSGRFSRICGTKLLGRFWRPELPSGWKAMPTITSARGCRVAS